MIVSNHLGSLEDHRDYVDGIQLNILDVVLLHLSKPKILSYWKLLSILNMCVKIVFAVHEVTRFEAIDVERIWLPKSNKTQNKGLYNTLNTPQLKSIIAVLYVGSIKPIFVRIDKRVPFHKFQNYIWKVMHIYVTCTGSIKLF